MNEMDMREGRWTRCKFSECEIGCVACRAAKVKNGEGVSGNVCQDDNVRRRRRMGREWQTAGAVRKTGSVAERREDDAGWRTRKRRDAGCQPGGSTDRRLELTACDKRQKTQRLEARRTYKTGGHQQWIRVTLCRRSIKEQGSPMADGSTSSSRRVRGLYRLEARRTSLTSTAGRRKRRHRDSRAIPEKMT